MKAVVYKGANDVRVEEVDEPRVEQPTDAIVRITSTGICGSDLHMYEGRTPVQPGTVFGHENMGVVEAVGSAVRQIREGDRVVMPFNIACGTCLNCERGFTNACLFSNPEGVSAGYGYAQMGPFRGGQAERLRVPFADFNCLKLPGAPHDHYEDDFVLLSDVFPTGYHATVLADVQPGMSVAVFGAGPVGLLAAYSAILRGAAEVYVVDAIPERLDRAEGIGAIPVDFTKGDPVETIFELRSAASPVADARRPGEEKMPGVMCGIDAVGYQAKDESSPDHERPTQVIEDLLRVVNPTGAIGVVGVYMTEDPGASSEAAKKGSYTIPWAKVFERGLRIGSGQCPVKRYDRMLRDLVIAGRAKPSFIVSQRLPLDAARDAYDQFDHRRPGFTKVILKPETKAA